METRELEKWLETPARDKIASEHIMKDVAKLIQAYHRLLDENNIASQRLEAAVEDRRWQSDY